MSKLILCYSPRTRLRRSIQEQNQIIQKICLSLDKPILDNLKSNMKSQSLNQHQFISLMLRNLHAFQQTLPNRDIILTKSLLQMFHEITIGKQQSIYWSDLSDYLINKARQSKIEDIKQSEEMYRKSTEQPKIKCQNKIQKSAYVRTLSLVLYLEENSSSIEVLNSQSLQSLGKPVIYKSQKSTLQSISKGQNKSGVKNVVVETNVKIIDFIYVSSGRYNILLCSLSNGIVSGRVFNNGSFVPAFHPDNDTELLEYKFDKVVYCMEWDANNETLYCGCQSDTIYKWSFKTSSISTLQCSNQDNLVTCLSNIPKLHIMASGSMDGKLIFWDTVTNLKKNVYKEHHRGILTMIFNQSTTLLFTAGFDHTICVWNPYVQGIINKIATHLETITQMSTHKDKLIAMDQKGCISMFNTKTFIVLNQLMAEPSNSGFHAIPSSFCLLQNPHRLLICGNRISLFVFEQTSINKYSDNNFTSHLHYLGNSLSLLTATSDTLNKWSMLTGELESSIKINNGGQVSTIEFDVPRELVYIAIRNTIFVYNSKNLLRIRELPVQPTEVNLIKAFFHFQKDQCIAVVQGSINIHIYKQSFNYKYQVLKHFNISKQVGITFITYNPIESNLTVGTNVGVVGVYDIDAGKSIANSNSMEQHTEIVYLHSLVLNDHNILLEVTKGGVVSLIQLSPVTNRLYSCQIKDCQNGQQNQRISCCDLDTKSLRLFVGDQKGFISCYGIRIVCDEIIIQMQREKEVRYRSRDKQSQSFQKLWMFKTHQQGVICLQFIQDSGLIVSSGYDRKIRIRKDNGLYLNEFRVNKEHNINPLFYIEKTIDGLEPFKDYMNKTKIAIKDNIQLGEESIFDPKYFVDKVETSELDHHSSNPDWKVQINFSKYCSSQKSRYLNFTNSTKTDVHVHKKEILPKLRQNLQKSINDSLKYIFNSEQGKNNIAIESSFMYQPKLSKIQSLPRISQSLKMKRLSKDNLNSLSKPRLKGLSHFSQSKPKIETLSKEVVNAYNKLNNIISYSFQSSSKNHLNKRLIKQ